MRYRVTHIRTMETACPALVVEGPASRRTRLSVSGVDDGGLESLCGIDTSVVHLYEEVTSQYADRATGAGKAGCDGREQARAVDL